MTEKRRVKIRNARIVPAETLWPWRCNPEDAVLLGELASEHPRTGVCGGCIYPHQSDRQTGFG